MSKQKKVTINGKEFTLQHPGVRWYVKTTDVCKNHLGVLQNEKYIDAIFENVVVDPVVKMDDFDDDYETMNKLVLEVERFLKGQQS